MKYIKLIFIIALTSSIAFTGCKKDEVAVPEACFTINGLTTDNITLAVGTAVVFKSCAIADLYVVWPGDYKHDYEKRPEKLTEVDQTKVVVADAGLAADLTSMSYTYTYQKAGTYTVTWVASNVGNDGEDVVFSTASKTIIVE